MFNAKFIPMVYFGTWIVLIGQKSNKLLSVNLRFYTTDGIILYLPEYYTFWAQGEPSNATGENCLEFSQQFNRWNDANCDIKKASVCQREYGILIG